MTTTEFQMVPGEIHIYINMFCMRTLKWLVCACTLTHIENGKANVNNY